MEKVKILGRTRFERKLIFHFWGCCKDPLWMAHGNFNFFWKHCVEVLPFGSPLQVMKVPTLGCQIWDKVWCYWEHTVKRIENQPFLLLAKLCQKAESKIKNSRMKWFWRIQSPQVRKKRVKFARSLYI